jgi:hypothetical protein
MAYCDSAGSECLLLPNRSRIAAIKAPVAKKMSEFGITLGWTDEMLTSLSKDIEICIFQLEYEYVVPRSWRDRILHHSTLMMKYLLFFHVCQHPSASSTLQQRPMERSIHSRLQKYGIRLLLKDLPNEYAVEYLKIAIDIVHVYLDTVPSLRTHWFTLLGDLSTFWLSIEEDHVSKTTLGKSGLFWYEEAASFLPEGQLSQRFCGLLEPENVCLFDIADDVSPAHDDDYSSDTDDDNASHTSETGFIYLSLEDAIDASDENSIDDEEYVGV